MTKLHKRTGDMEYDSVKLPESVLRDLELLHAAELEYERYLADYRRSWWRRLCARFSC